MKAVISGVGLVSAAGSGTTPFHGALRAGVPLARPIDRFDASTFPVPLAGEVPGLDARRLARAPKEAKLLARASVLALGALADLERACPAPWGCDPWRTGLFLGVGLEQGAIDDVVPSIAASARGGRIDDRLLASDGMPALHPLASLKTLPNMALGTIAMRLGDRAPRGMNAAYAPFDAAAVEAVEGAVAALDDGDVEVALAGGVDAPVSPMGLLTFHRLGVTRPLGEAAALFLVETAAGAAAGGRPVLAEIAGIGRASDDAVPGRPRATGAVGALAAALDRAGRTGSAIDAAVVSGAADAQALESVGIRTDRRVEPAAIVGECAAAGGAVGIAAALALLADGASRVVVGAAAFGGAYGAIVLERPGS